MKIIESYLDSAMPLPQRTHYMRSGYATALASYKSCCVGIRPPVVEDDEERVRAAGGPPLAAMSALRVVRRCP